MRHYENNFREAQALDPLGPRFVLKNLPFCECTAPPRVTPRPQKTRAGASGAGNAVLFVYLVEVCLGGSGGQGRIDLTGDLVAIGIANAKARGSVKSLLRKFQGCDESGDGGIGHDCLSLW
jgi:hypothetical protein